MEARHLLFDVPVSSGFLRARQGKEVVEERGHHRGVAALVSSAEASQPLMGRAQADVGVLEAELLLGVAWALSRVRGGGRFQRRTVE